MAANKCIRAFHGHQTRARGSTVFQFSRTTVSRVCREWCKKEKQFLRGRNALGQRRRARLVKADRKVTVKQMTTHYNSGMQKSCYHPWWGGWGKDTGASQGMGVKVEFNSGGTRNLAKTRSYTGNPKQGKIQNQS